jgi:hypothetical protein
MRYGTLVVLLSAITTLHSMAENVPAPSPGASLLGIKRVYVDQLTGGPAANQIRDLLIASLQNAGNFTVTENEDNADAYLRGTASEDVYTETHSLDESIGGRASFSRGRAATGATRSTARDTDGGGLSVSERESSRIQERKHDAMISVRLVRKDGDVVWSTTQESGGAKFKGANADAAAKVARQLSLDLERARRSATVR